jgi:hypothetical protein
MHYTEALAVAREEAHALGERLHGKVLKPDMRTRVALACFAIAQQHHSSIVLLLSHPNPMPSSAFSLLRPLAEATFRGFWIARCASDEQINNVISGAKKQIDTASIVRQLIESNDLQDKFPNWYQSVWPNLSSHIHTYENSLIPWLVGQDVELQLNEEKLFSLLNLANQVAPLIEAGVQSLQAHSNITESPH